jgi:hypothetical protein
MLRVINVRKVRCAEHVARIGYMRNVYTVAVRSPERNGLFGKPRLKEEDFRDNILEWNQLGRDWVKR